MQKNTDSDNQLNMSYAGDNRFRDVIMSSMFFVNVELSSGMVNANAEDLKDMLHVIQEDSRIFACDVDDSLDGHSFDDSVKTAEMACALSGKTVIPFIAGKDRSFDSVLNVVNKYRVMGFRDFVAVTGESVENAGAQGEAYPGKYTDSVDILHLAAESGLDNVLGVVVNPFKYVIEDSVAQYAKLVRKINNGAAFVVAQAGWDPKKYQELIWFLRMRNILQPVFARIMVLDKPVNALASDCVRPGVYLPLHIVSALEKEMNSDKFLEMQVERAAYLAIGCEFMGYSGLQIAGIRKASVLTAFLDKLDAFRQLFSSFAEWAEDWNRKYDGVSFIPFSREFSHKAPYYLFDSLMNPSMCAFDNDMVRITPQVLPPPSMADKVQSKLADPDTPEWIKKTVKHWTGTNGDGIDGLSCLGLDNKTCPKRLVHGPCGDSHADGSCVACGMPCFFQRVARLASWNRQMDFLEGREEASELKN